MRMKFPEKQNYDSFVRHFAQRISKKYPDVCFYTYGSYNREDCVFGRSDIDGGIIINSFFVTNKNEVLDISEILCDCLEKNQMDKIQFNLLDIGSSKDGRFLSYTPDYTNYLKENWEVQCGPNYIDYLNGLDFKSGILYSTAFSFRRIRNNFLNHIYDSRNNLNKFKERAEDSFGALISLPKKLIYLQMGKVIDLRPIAFRKLEDMLDVDISFSKEILDIFNNTDKFYEFIENKNKILGLYSAALGEFESILKKYVYKFPETNQHEIKI